MRTFTHVTRALGAASLLAMAAAPVLAEGKHDRATQEMAAARAKIDAANKFGAGVNTPHLAAGAEAALQTAGEDLSAGHKEAAINDAIHAQQLADTALNEAQASHARMAADTRADAAQARQQASDANARADAASAQAADASVRADAATQQAASASADAMNARAELSEAQSQPAQTTVTTETTKTAHPATARKVVVQKAQPARTTETTKTTVTTDPHL